MMKNYHLYIFTQENCPPCTRLKKHLETLTEDERAELDLVPLKTASGERTALATDLSVDLSPTLVVTHEELSCSLDQTGEEFCDQFEESVERFIGANSIIEHLNATLDAYTYAHSE